jgi:hypothetical protein
MSWELIIGLGGLLIGLVSLLIGGFTTYLAYRSLKEERTAFYRRALYERQVDACRKIVDLVSKQFDTIRELRHHTNKDITGLIEKASTTNDEFRELYRLSLVFLPTSANEAIQSFGRAALNEIRLFKTSRETIDETKKEKAKQEFDLKYKSLLIALRMVIGTDPLSDETIKLIGIDQGF